MARLNEVVQALHHEAFPDRFNEPGNALVEPAFRRMLEPSGANQAETKAWLCVDQDDEALGYVVAVLRESPVNPFTKAVRWIELDQICVLDEARGLGAGRLLAARVLAWAQDRGILRVELSVWDFNAGARAFFDSLGFKPLWRREAVQLAAP